MKYLSFKMMDHNSLVDVNDFSMHVVSTEVLNMTCHHLCKILLRAMLFNTIQLIVIMQKLI